MSKPSTSTNIAVSQLTSPPPVVGSHLLIKFPVPKVLHLQLNRPAQMNSMTDGLEIDIGKTLEWFENEKSLWVLVLSGSGKAFCAGQDLKEWLGKQSKYKNAPHTTTGSTDSTIPLQTQAENDAMVNRAVNQGGFGSLSTFRSSKPIILAVDGLVMGGGMEILLNTDLVISSSRAKFALPEVLRGVFAAQGGIPRLVRSTSHQLASEMLLTGRTFTAKEASRIGLINKIVEVGGKVVPEKGQKLVLKEALRYARMIIAASPDAVRITKKAILNARDGVLDETAVDATTAESLKSVESRSLYVGSNIREGLSAFKEKRAPQWSDPVVLPVNDGKRQSKL
ncbi:unnamed protein product [Sympodiomycopsis kandeliae]